MYLCTHLKQHMVCHDMYTDYMEDRTENFTVERLVPPIQQKHSGVMMFTASTVTTTCIHWSCSPDLNSCIQVTSTTLCTIKEQNLLYL